ncbi:MAG: DUF481 domain-containing protein [Myxococcota bacterium]|nr:DUF481 domain-containing protein [Myxococcota bacterium]
MKRGPIRLVSGLERSPTCGVRRSRRTPIVQNSTWRLIFLALAGLLLALHPANAEGDGEGKDKGKTVSLPDTKAENAAGTNPDAMPDFKNGAPRWYPPDDRPAKWEWVELTSGEWLKGDIKGIRSDKLDFDSSQFDDITLKMKDVVQTYSSVVNTFVFTRRRVVIGIGRITQNEVIIETAAGEMRYPRQQLISLVVGDHNEWKLWSGSMTTGVSATSGNTEQTTANLQADLNRKGAFLGLTFNYIGNLGSSNNVTNVNNQQINFLSQLFIYDRFYLIPTSFEYYSDEFQNINLRIRPGAGVGYEIFDDSDFTWTVNGTAIYEYQDSISSLQSQGSTFESFAIQMTSNLKYDITSDITLNAKYNVVLAIPSSSHVDQQAIVKLDIDITKYVSLNSTLNWARVGDPVPLEDGTIPKKNDMIITLGASLNF